ncbi:MAG: Flp pilus assembly protein CpaB [Phycisphaerae bacterium]|nr:Flp pilus assembly protein CpaB [Phycisphaerae bacterium]
MKWTIGFLVGLGILASICVVLLVNALRVDSSIQSSRGEIPVVLAATDLPVWSVLTAEDVEISKIIKSDAPAGCFTNTALVIGKVLSMDVVKGQILTESKILAQGGPADIAALLGPGMRAVSVTVSGDQVSGGLLYPRCFVDVLASFKLSGSSRSGESKGEALSTTLLERVKVLAIAGESMLTTPDQEGKKASRATSQRLTVTLELDSKQAEALQLAINNGSISLALRNPLDTDPVNPEATVLNRGKLSRMGGLLGTTVKTNPGAPSSDSSDSPSAPLNAWSEQESPNWDVTVIRGNKITDVQVNETTP